MGASESRTRRRLKRTTKCTVHEIAPVEDDRDQLAVCLASISDMALTGADPEGRRTPVIDHQVSRDVTVSAALDEATVAAAAVAAAEATSGRRRSLKHRLKQRVQRNRSVTGEESINNQLQLINSLDSQDDDSTDWAMMRSWMVWCLRDKLGDAELLSRSPADTSGSGFSTAADIDDETNDDEPSPICLSSTSFCRRRPCSVGRTLSGGGPRLVRQHAVQERSPRLTGPPSTGRLSQRLSVRTRRQGSSLDGGGPESGPTTTAAGSSGAGQGRLTVAAAYCSAQSSFESYGSAG